jgi:hypothetical protein
MDVDCLDKEAHAENMQKGLCFNCHEHGHWATKCLKKDKKKKKVSVHQEKIEEDKAEDKVETCGLAEDF